MEAPAGEEPGRAGEEPGGAGEEPGGVGEEPDGAGEEPGRAGEEPVDEEEGLLMARLQDAAEGEHFVEAAFHIIMKEAVRRGTDVNEKVCQWVAPEELESLLELELPDTGESEVRLLQHCRQVIRYSVNTAHPRFFNQLFAGLDYHALVGRFITETLNTSQYTYEISPVFVLMEDVVLKKLRELIGWMTGDGIFCPGGSMSNMFAINLARHRLYPHVKQRGLWVVPRLVIFTSEEGHYSLTKGAAFLGLGTDNVWTVKTDAFLAENKIIFETMTLIATAGTTILGAFDPLAEIADVCQQHGVWADSVTWNPHKMLMAGLQCSAFLLKDQTDLLGSAHAAGARYLFQTDRCYQPRYDTGDRSVQCGRRVDCLKLWLMWKAIGTRGLRDRVNRAFACTRYLVTEMHKRDGFRLLMEPQFVNVCFWYIPPCLRGGEETPDFWQQLGRVAPLVKQRMVVKGSMMVGYQPHGKHVNFFRQILISPQVTREDLDFFLDEIERLGSDFQPM
uniref:Cysteine sulfinic acid decarboxylase n=1 Tax=Callorhinchus milii TaxID=7868 RepID=A0A4W3IKL5_CALMI